MSTLPPLPIYLRLTGRAPIGLTMFVGSMGLMEGKSGDELSDKFSHMFWRE